MKTNQVLKRNDAFVQRTKDGYFDSNTLINNWNLNNPSKRKELAKYKANNSTKEYIEQLIKRGVENPMLISNKGTWMHPKLFIDFAMWVSVEFKDLVIDYVLDGLIKSRNDSGDYYNQMCATILETYVNYYHCKPPAHIYIEEANLIKSLVTNKPRNEMNEQELKQITYLQKVNSNLLKKGIGKSARVKRLHEASEIEI